MHVKEQIYSSEFPFSVYEFGNLVQGAVAISVY